MNFLRSIKCVLAISVWSLSCMAQYAPESQDFARYEGLAGRELAAAVRADFSPKNRPLSTSTDGLAAGLLPSWPGTGERVMLVIPERWSGTPILDYYNYVREDTELSRLRSDYPPGDVADVTGAGEGWSVGYMYVGGERTNAWQPTAERLGDLARRYMYLALIYPKISPEIWGGRAFMIMADGDWPLLTTAGRELFSRWSIADPVDDRELTEVAAIAAVQGNENPFIVFPELFDYLWGDKAGEAYVPDDKREQSPLRGEYSRSADRYISLYSPYVEADAVWSFDGSEVSGDSIDLAGVSPGHHIISYRTSGSKGKLKILVKE